jgi:hypothetical protein
MIGDLNVYCVLGLLPPLMSVKTYQGLSDYNTQWHAHIMYYILHSFCFGVVIEVPNKGTLS